MRHLPLNTWLVIDQKSAQAHATLVSQRATQRDAETARDKRNKDGRTPLPRVHRPRADRPADGRVAGTNEFNASSVSRALHATNRPMEDQGMQTITGDMKMADVIRRWPHTAQVFRTRGCRDADAGPLARLMTVRNVARMEGLDLALLLEDLNGAAASYYQASPSVGNAPPQNSSSENPPVRK